MQMQKTETKDVFRAQVDQCVWTPDYIQLRSGRR